MLCGTKKQEVVYPADGGGELTVADFTVTGSGIRKSEVSRCLDCGLYFASSRVPSRLYYADMVDVPYEQGKNSRRLEFEDALRFLQKTFSKAQKKIRFLDVGCLSGIFLECLRKNKDWSGQGIEPSRWGVDICRQKELEVTQGYFEDFKWNGPCFDVVTMFDCLEHSPSPKVMIQKAGAILEDGGMLLITTPNIASLFHAIFRRRFWFIESMHLFYFSPKTIRKLLENCGFEVVKIKKHFKCLKVQYALLRLSIVFPVMGPLFRALSRIPFFDKWNLKFYAGQMFVVARKRKEAACPSPL